MRSIVRLVSFIACFVVATSSTAMADGICRCIKPHDLGSVVSCVASENVCREICREYGPIDSGLIDSDCTNLDVTGLRRPSCLFPVKMEYSADSCSNMESGPDQSCSIPSNQPAVKLYEHTNFNGAERSFPAGFKWADLNSQRYCTAGLRQIGGTVSSIRVPSGNTVELYSGPDFTGTCLKIVGSDMIDNLDATNRVYNDQARSMIIYHQSAESPVAGRSESACPRS